MGKASTARLSRVLERRRAVALARHYREFEGLSIGQIAQRLGRSPATVKAYFYDPSDTNKRPTDSPAPLTPAPALRAPPHGSSTSAESTVDLDGNRSASDLDELDLGEQAGAVA